MDGLLPVYKPVGLTSYDIIRAYKHAQGKIIGTQKLKIGHGGTLDPFAEGVLILLLGKATKLMNQIMTLKKTYVATSTLGTNSDTLDSTGVLTPCAIKSLELSQIESSLVKFRGEISQRIPDYSATKVDGVNRYVLARAGKQLPEKFKNVTIYELDLVSYQSPNCIFMTTVSSGTYIRQLSVDIFENLGVASYLSSLVRTWIGPISTKMTASLRELENNNIEDKIISLERFSEMCQTKKY